MKTLINFLGNFMRMDTSVETLDDKSLEKRADYLTDEDLSTWTVQTDFLETIQKELLNSYPRLFAGPRGTGKTHQMRLAHLKTKNNNELPYSLFVTFNNYYHLEPLLIKTSNATQIFHTWVLAKICISILVEEDSNLQSNVEEMIGFSISELEIFISSAEKGVFNNQYDSILQSLNIHKVIEIIKYVTKKKNRRRAVLFLDDAAYTLTHTYMIEFFEIFRSLKNSMIAPKASVYPGTTQYGPRFHLWQDADLVMMWEKFDSARYISFINEIIKLRLNDEIGNIPSDILEIFKYLSFGIPRSFISLVSFYNRYSQKEKRSPQASLNATVELLCNLMKEEYLSLSGKLPQYDSVIKTGLSFFEKIVNEVSKENLKDEDESRVVVGIETINDLTQKRMINFLVEAGLLYDTVTPVKHGVDREYERYIPHVGFLFRERAFNSGKGFNSGETLKAIKRKEAKHPIRRKLETVLGEEIRNIKLNLPTCTHCGEKRLSPSQKFCHHCGKELKDLSSYELCMDISLANLPLTPWQKEKLSKETSIRTVRDFLVSPNVALELQKASGIGKVRSLTIYTSVMDFVQEFLS